MPEGADDGIGRRERQPFGDDAYGIDGVPKNSTSELIEMEMIGKELANQTPINSMGTSTENAFLNSVDCSQPTSSARVYILYAKGTCWKFPAGSRPTLCSIPARLGTRFREFEVK